MAISDLERETWTSIPGWPKYEVSSFGRVKSVHAGDERILKASPNVRGYAVVTLCDSGFKRSYRVNRLVLLAFAWDCPGGMEACHKNGNKLDNRLSNLRWGTHLSNLRDRESHGTETRGERNGLSKLSEKDIPAIFSMNAAGMKPGLIASTFNVGRVTIVDVLARRTWKHVSI